MVKGKGKGGKIVWKGRIRAVGKGRKRKRIWKRGSLWGRDSGKAKEAELGCHRARDPEKARDRFSMEHVTRVDWWDTHPVDAQS